MDQLYIACINWVYRGYKSRGIDLAIKEGDVVVEFFEKPQSAAFNGNFRVENTSKLLDFKTGKIDELMITYYTTNGAYEKSSITRKENKITFIKSNSIYKQKGTFTCQDFDFRNGFALTNCESDTEEEVWEVTAVPLTMTMIREAKLLN